MQNYKKLGKREEKFVAVLTVLERNIVTRVDSAFVRFPRCLRLSLLHPLNIAIETGNRLRVLTLHLNNVQSRGHGGTVILLSPTSLSFIRATVRPSAALRAGNVSF